MRARCFSIAPAKSSPRSRTPKTRRAASIRLRGIIRLALPVLYGTREIIPRLPKFLAAHPMLRVEMTVVDARQDLVAEGADVAIRLGELNNSVFGARKLQTLERMLVASPAYLKARGTPKDAGGSGVA